MKYELTEEAEKLLFEYSTKENKNPQETLNEIIKLSLAVPEDIQIDNTKSSQNIIGNCFPSSDSVTKQIGSIFDGFKSIKEFHLDYKNDIMKLEIEFNPKKLEEEKRNK